MTFRDRDPFFVQENPRGLWHVESLDNPEMMLCGVEISVDARDARVQTSWGLKPCPWCRKLLEDELRSFGLSSSPLPRRTSWQSVYPVRSRATTTSSGRTT